MNVNVMLVVFVLWVMLIMKLRLMLVLGGLFGCCYVFMWLFVFCSIRLKGIDCWVVMMGMLCVWVRGEGVVGCEGCL